MTITFNCYPIDTAPKDREIMVYDKRYGWLNAGYDGGFYAPNIEVDEHYEMECMPLHPTHWAEVADMVPPPQYPVNIVVSDQVPENTAVVIQDGKVVGAFNVPEDNPALVQGGKDITVKFPESRPGEWQENA